MKTKPFDSIEMIEQQQAEIQLQMESMSREEQLAFWHARAEKLRERQRQIQNLVTLQTETKPNDPPVQ